MKDSSKVKNFLRKRYQAVRDYFKYRVLVDQKQLLIIPGPAPLTDSIVNSLKDTWRITSLDVHLNLKNSSYDKNQVHTNLEFQNYALLKE
jgi:hypothetical protein